MGDSKEEEDNMEMKKLIPLVSLLITAFLMGSIYIIGDLLNERRENFIEGQVLQMHDDFLDMQIFFMMSDTYGDEMACIAIESKLKELDNYVWKLGEKIDSYRAASEEFQKSSYYLEQKQAFNENEVFYQLLLQKMVRECNLSKDLILFFYQNSADCRKCDDQSFILTDIKVEDDKGNRQEIAIFSYDMDLNITTLNLLADYYNINEYPCIIINDEVFCGIQDRSFIIKQICSRNPQRYICEKAAYLESVQYP